MKYFLLIFASLSFQPLAALGQIQEGVFDNPGRSQLTLDDLRTFTDVFNQLRSNFVHEVDDHTLLVAAIDGMVSTLDPWSAFLDSEQSQMMDDGARGRYGGIGINVDLQDNRIYVQSVYPGGPADKSGVLAGDLILNVEGRPVRGRRIEASLDALTGEPDTEVAVRFKSGKEPSRELKLVREYIPISSVEQELLEDGIGYFEVTHFHRNTHLELEASINSVKDQAGGNLNGIILDLRGNPGGVVLPAVAMADGFLDEGMIVYTQGRYEASLLEFRAEPGQWAADVPMVILVDSHTASASEVLTGALQDHGRAVVMGEKTFGKGSIQSVFKLRNGSMLRLTTAHYFTPSGKTIHNNGIEPDIIDISGSDILDLTATKDQDHLIIKAMDQLSRMDSG